MRPPDDLCICYPPHGPVGLIAIAARRLAAAVLCFPLFIANTSEFEVNKIVIIQIIKMLV